MGPVISTLLAVLVAAAAVCAGGSLAADPGEAPSARPWTPAALREALGALPAGDSNRGGKAHGRLFCGACHGDAGVAPTQHWPHLAGQRAAYTAKMLLDYRSGLRREGLRAELMRDIAVLATRQQVADVAAFYAAQPAPQDDGTPRPPVRLGPADLDAERLARRGDPVRLLTPCASCHGAAGQGGIRETPALAGQNPRYFVATMEAFQAGARVNDCNQGMRFFARRLTAAETAALAVHYADLPRRAGSRPAP